MHSSRAFQWIWLVLGPLLIVFSRVFVFSALFTESSPGTWHWHIGALAGIWIPMLNYNLFGDPSLKSSAGEGFFSLASSAPCHLGLRLLSQAYCGPSGICRCS